MGKSQKYTEDQLLDAVIRYSEVEKKKIKATELARWCRANIEGLEEVRDYHFTRSKRSRDEKTGRMVEKIKLCTIRINEINKSRSLTISINTNVLLRASNIDTFMGQPDAAKRKMIVETRETVDRLLRCNGTITRENEALKMVNKEMKMEIIDISEKVKALQKAQKALTKQVTYIMRVTDESARREMLSKMGITDGYIDLGVYNESITQGIEEVLDINKELGKYVSLAEESVLDPKIVTGVGKTLFEEIMNGLDE